MLSVPFTEEKRGTASQATCRILLLVTRLIGDKDWGDCFVFKQFLKLHLFIYSFGAQRGMWKPWFPNPRIRFHAPCIGSSEVPVIEIWTQEVWLESVSLISCPYPDTGHYSLWISYWVREASSEQFSGAPSAANAKGRAGCRAGVRIQSFWSLIWNSLLCDSNRYRIGLVCQASMPASLFFSKYLSVQSSTLPPRALATPHQFLPQDLPGMGHHIYSWFLNWQTAQQSLCLSRVGPQISPRIQLY